MTLLVDDSEYSSDSATPSDDSEDSSDIALCGVVSIVLSLSGSLTLSVVSHQHRYYQRPKSLKGRKGILADDSARR